MAGELSLSSHSSVASQGKNLVVRFPAKDAGLPRTPDTVLVQGAQRADLPTVGGPPRRSPNPLGEASQGARCLSWQRAGPARASSMPAPSAVSAQDPGAMGGARALRKPLRRVSHLSPFRGLD